MFDKQCRFFYRSRVACCGNQILTDDGGVRMSASSTATNFPLTTLRVAITGENNIYNFYDKALGRHRDVNNQPDKMSAAEYSKIAKAAGEAGIDRILIAGCEPLLRKDVSAVVKALSSSKKVQEVRFVTNGVFLKDCADSLRRVGLKHLEINLDSLNFIVYQKISRRDGLYRVLDGLQKSERIHFDSLTLNVIIMRGINERELIDFAILTKTKQLHLRFLEYNIFDETQASKQLHYPMVQAKHTIQDFQQLIADGIEGTEVYRFKEAQGTISFADLKSSHLNFNQPGLFLDSQGILHTNYQPSRQINILKEFDKDAPEERIAKVLQRAMLPLMPPSTRVLVAPNKAAAQKRRVGRGKASQAQL